MESLSGPQNQDALFKIGMLCKLRHHNVTEEVIAAKLEFGSVDAMHTQLRNWGLPGLLPKRVEDSSEQPKRKTPKAGSQDAGKELPRPVAAAHLFEEAVDTLHRIVEDLEHYRLVRKNGRFINTHVYNAPTYFPRSSFTPAQWEELCETYGHDVSSEGFTVFNSVTKDPTGGGRYPPRPLVNLIAVYALLERDMRALLQVLNPGLSSEDGKRISGLLYKNKHDHGKDGLIRTAEQVAELVCGGGGGRGSTPQLSPREHNVACSITDYREHGWADEEICEHYASLGFSKNRILELGQLGLRWPED